MKIIKKDTPVLFLRVSNYKNYDFIKEHMRVLKENGSVWILKIGRMMNLKFIDEVIEKDGGLILKSPVKSGNHFYYCKLTKDRLPEDESELIYPEYYTTFLDEQYYTIDDFKKDGYWYKIESMREIPEEKMYNFIFAKTKKELSKIALYSRVVNFYLISKKDFDI